jgi:hypothetical protein
VFCVGHLGHLFHNRIWKGSGLQGVNTGRSLIAKNELPAKLKAMLSNALAFLDAASASKLRFTLVLNPPPRRNNPSMTRLGTSPELVLAIDAVGRHILTEKAKAVGAIILDAPDISRDENGFLKRRFCADPRSNGTPDPHHANAEYGKLILLQLYNAAAPNLS